MTNKSASEVLNEYVAEFGKKDGHIVRNLTDKVVNLTMRWQMFLYFFSGPHERVDVLNEASGLTAKVLQGLLWDDALMRIRQMTDPARTLKKTSVEENLSARHLVEIAGKNDVDLEPAFETAMTALEPAKRYASKYIAHSDMPHALGEKASPVARKDTTDAVNAICIFVQEFHQRVRGTTHLLVSIPTSDDHQQFLLRLYQGNQAEKDLDMASRKASKGGNWAALNRPDIPDWIWEKTKPHELF